MPVLHWVRVIFHHTKYYQLYNYINRTTCYLYCKIHTPCIIYLRCLGAGFLLYLITLKCLGECFIVKPYISFLITDIGSCLQRPVSKMESVTWHQSLYLAKFKWLPVLLLRGICSFVFGISYLMLLLKHSSNRLPEIWVRVLTVNSIKNRPFFVHENLDTPLQWNDTT